MRTEELDYRLPPESIAQRPAEPRDSARLLDTRDLTDHHFLDLPSLLLPGDLVLVNHTRVRAARLRGRKEATGGEVEALLLGRVDDSQWEAAVRPARRLRAGTRLWFGDLEAEVVTDPVDGVAVLRLPPEHIEERLQQVGELPLPPYVHSPLPDPERYQTIFAQVPGSAAAPTAGLHFTPQVVEALGARGVELASVDLEVGLATFRPIAVDEVEEHEMHAEAYRLGPEVADSVQRCRERGGRVVAVGTTVVRVLETCGRPDGTVAPGAGRTRLFLRPGSRFRVVDALVTNFHLPRSSLLALLAAFVGERWREAYQVALQRGYRFLSLGDAMYCEREPAE